MVEYSNKVIFKPEMILSDLSVNWFTHAGAQIINLQRRQLNLTSLLKRVIQEPPRNT